MAELSTIRDALNVVSARTDAPIGMMFWLRHRLAAESCWDVPRPDWFVYLMFLDERVSPTDLIQAREISASAHGTERRAIARPGTHKQERCGTPLTDGVNELSARYRRQLRLA